MDMDSSSSIDPALFTDWQIMSNRPEIGFAYPGGLPVNSAPSIAQYAEQLSLMAEKHHSGMIDFGLRMPVNTTAETGEVIEKIIVYRGHRESTLAGNLIILRKMPEHVPELTSLAPTWLYRNLMSKSLIEGGLVMVCGPAGSGKSTTLGGVISARLKTFGGVCFTIEDPAEMPLSGSHGDGICYQTELTDARSMHDALKGSLRCFPAATPGILMVGEVRDALSAQQLITAAANGLLVLCTVHANDLETGIQRMVGLASTGESEVWASSLAASLRLIVHQRIVNHRLVATMLCNPIQANPVQAAIRDEKYHQLRNEIARQKRQLAQSSSSLLDQGRRKLN